MSAHNNTTHQKAQIEVINKIEQQAKTNTMQFSTVAPVYDYENDTRIALTSVHFLKHELLHFIQQQILNPLINICPHHYYYQPSSLHLTIKNIRVISDPPTYDVDIIQKVKKVFEMTIPRHKIFTSYFYRLLIFPHNLSLIGTTDPGLDHIHMDLDKELLSAGVPDDKQYINSRYFFSNITLIRFSSQITQKFRNKVNEISQRLIFKPYEVDSVTLLSCNAVLHKQQKIGFWKLKRGCLPISMRKGAIR